MHEGRREHGLAGAGEARDAEAEGGLTSWPEASQSDCAADPAREARSVMTDTKMNASALGAKLVEWGLASPKRASAAASAPALRRRSRERLGPSAQPARWPSGLGARARWTAPSTRAALGRGHAELEGGHRDHDRRQVRQRRAVGRESFRSSFGPRPRPRPCGPRSCAGAARPGAGRGHAGFGAVGHLVASAQAACGLRRRGHERLRAACAFGFSPMPAAISGTRYCGVFGWE